MRVCVSVLCVGVCVWIAASGRIGPLNYDETKMKCSFLLNYWAIILRQLSQVAQVDGLLLRVGQVCMANHLFISSATHTHTRTQEKLCQTCINKNKG